MLKILKIVLMLFVLVNFTFSAKSKNKYSVASISSKAFNANAVPSGNFNPNLNLNSSIGSVTVKSSGVNININSNSNFNPNSNANFNPNTLKVNSSSSFNKNSISFSNGSISNIVNTNNTIVNNSQSGCFFDTVFNVIDRLQNSVNYYSNLCDLNKKPKLNRLIFVARIIGAIEGYKNTTPNQMPTQIMQAVNSLDQFSDFKFSSYLVQIKEGVIKGQNIADIIKNLWAGMSDELDLIIKNNNYPIFFRHNIWSLIRNERSLNILRQQYSVDRCIPNNWDDILQITDLVSDQNFMKVYKSHGGRCKVDAYDIPIYSNAFENGGIAFTFWGSENLIELEGKTKSPFVGYINNAKIYEYNLIPQNYSVQHQLRILDKNINIKSDANCATYYFVIISIQKQCDKFMLYYSVRILASNSRHSGQIELSADKVENLHLILDKNLTISNAYYKNFKYTPDVEFLLLSYSLDSANWKTFTQRAFCAPNCEYSNGNKCLLCKKPTFNYQGSCVTQCPFNTYLKDGLCLPCSSQCLTCNGPNNGNCITCKEPFYFTNGNCDIRCPEYLAADDKRNCQPCGQNCLACKDIKTCGKCNAESFLKEGKCVPNCGNYYFKAFNPNICKPCPNGCLTCESAEKCLSCTEGFFLKAKDCVPNCGNEFWGDKGTNTCKPCGKNCKTCKDSVNCNECNKGFNIHNQDCVSNCPLGTISLNGVCVKCTDPNCDVCASNIADCKTCNKITFLKGSKCVTSCGTEYYADNNKICQSCPKDCNVCNKDKCLQCKDNQFVLKDTICVKECIDGYIPSGNICIKCTFPTNCKKCMNNNLDSCTVCYNDKVLHMGKCIDKCPERFYPKDGECLPCGNGCYNCQNKYNCLVCLTTHFWQNNICVEKCDIGFAAIGNNICQPCKVLGCENCSKSHGTCEKCQGKKYLYNNQCIDKCPLGAYPLSTMTCDVCPNDCIECTNKFTCTKCKPGKVLQGSNCVSVCDDGFVAINGECTKCKNINCRRCLASDLIKCQECPVGALIYNGDCVKVCPTKTYPNNGSCIECKKPCNSCKNDKECIDCVPKFSLHGTTCTDNCPTKTVSINNKCHNCHDKNCLKCKDVVANSCIECDKGLILFSGVCMINCPENYFNENGVCKPCLTNCKKCKNNNTCDECISKFFLKDGNQCVSECGDGYVLYSNGICRKCHSSCLNCKNSNVNECTKCYPKYFLSATECKSTCPEGTYGTDKMTCEPCPMTHCRDCKGGQTCTSCEANYLLENNKCKLPPCSEGWVLKAKSNECIKCEVNNCKSCPNTNLKTCDDCIANYYLIENLKCEKECIIGTFKNPVNKKCQKCSKNCISCTDDLHCSQCENNFYLHEGHCVSQCPPGFSKLSGKCMPCQVKECDTCPDNKNCEKCKLPFVLQDGLCSKDCNKGYFNNKGVCKKCPIYCDECKEENKCMTCQKGKVLSADDKCIDNCPSGSIEIVGKCVKCQGDKNCDKCSNKDLKQCLDCNGNLVLKSNTCVNECGDNFYTSSRKCYPCKEHCNKCVDANKCIECENGFALHQDNCISPCPKGYRKENGKCLNCSAECESCDSTKCLICINGTFLENGKCVKTCSKGYYTAHGIQCHPCDRGCLSCFTEKTCEICREGLFLKDGKCVQDCGVEYVPVSGKCEKCGPYCLECSKLNPKECKNCIKGKPLLNGLCTDNCNPKHYLENNKCFPCFKDCDLCENDKSCKKCTPPLYLTYDQKSCRTTCLDGFKPDQGTCVPCEDKKCQKCRSNVNICEICNTPNLLLNGICVSSCPDGYYRDHTGVRCSKCDPTCKRCVDSKKCTECAKGFTLQDDLCVSTCNVGWISVNSVCKKCDTLNCEVCNTNLIKCEKCDKGKVLFTVTNSTLSLASNLTRRLVVNNSVITNNSTISVNSTLCLDICPSGFYENKGVCLNCGENCDKCTNLVQCNLCSKGYVLQDGKCQTRCNKYFVEKNSECVRCSDPKCVNCDSLTGKTCTACDENHVLKNNECKTHCGSSFFKFEVGKENNICLPCPFKCEVCQNKYSCDKCMEGAFLKINECVPDCGKGWVVKSNTKCIECTSKYCIACDPNNPDKCITCTSDTYLKNNLCVKTCGEKYYASDKGLCISCTDPNCLSCSPANKCNVCEKGKVLLNGQCKNECLSGMIPNKENVCVDCKDANCHICELTNLNKCSKCKNGYLLLPELTCDSKCPAKHYNHLNERCLPCAKNCEVCTSDLNCQTCTGKMVLDNNNMCTDFCNKGEVDVKGKCQKCKDTKCLKCQVNDLTICEVCFPGSYLYQGKCVSQCPERTFTLGSNCVDCDKKCKKCISATQCKVCDSKYYLLKDDCLDQCPEGYVDYPGECIKCENSEKTKRCQKENPKVPKECKDNYVLDNICADQCSDGKYPNEKRICTNCGAECIKCMSLTDCKKCSSKTFLYRGKCIDHCLSGTVNILGECVDCKNPNCHECQLSDLNKCISCKEKLFFLNDNCLTNCPVGYYIQGKICEKCDSKCAECKNKNTCDRCLNQFILHEGVCISECPKGYVLRNGKCYACVDKRCTVCNNSDLNQCMTCKEGYLLNGLCHENCPVTFRTEESTRSCVPCSNYCDKCDAKGCTTCTKGFYFSESDPRFCMECSDPIMVIVGNRCEKCKVQGCKRCVDANTNFCKVCDSAKVLVDGKCLDNCPLGTFRVGQSCQPCEKNCKVCSNAKYCDECEKPNVVHNGVCIPKCPSSWVQDNGKCVQCAQQECDTCDSKNKAICSTCILPSMLYNSQCYKLCPNGTYPDPPICKECPKGCSICTKNKCEGCSNDLKLKGSECVKECGEGYYDNGNRCEKCIDSNCIVCSPASICKKCNKTSFLMEGTNTCVITCKEGYYENIEKGLCIQCDEGCASCKSSKQCTLCEKGLFNHNGKCIQTCPDGYSPISGVCQPCQSTDCGKCSVRPDECETCIKGYSFNQRCIPTCPKGTFIKNGKCKYCNKKCDECKSKIECVKCKSEFNIFKGKCIDRCSDGKVEINGKCISCSDKNCKSCLRDTSICVECNSQFVLYEKTCRPTCPDGTYAGDDRICVTCSDGCRLCTDENNCKKCHDGFFLHKNKCLRECPKGMWGNCNENMCYNCLEACEDCVDGTARNCPKCSKGYFKNEDVCVNEKGCRKGTYPNTNTRKCTSCRIPFCAECNDQTRCKVCVRGYELSQKGECVESKTFIPAINQNSKLFSSKTLKLYRNTETKSFKSELKGTGVDSDNVTFTFWLRMVSSSKAYTKIFETESTSISMNTRLEIIKHEGKNICKLTLSQDSTINVLQLGSCSYEDLYDWTFFSITLNKMFDKAHVEVRIVNNKGIERERELSFPITKTVTFINIDSNIVFNNNLNKGDILNSSPYEIANFNIVDYDATLEDIQGFYSMKPNNCDYTCTDCKGTCIQCPGDVKPTNEGYCPASFISVKTDFQRLLNVTSVDLRTKIIHRLDSERYGLFLWFNSENSFNKTFEIANVYYDYPESQYLIHIYISNSRLFVQIGEEIFNAFEKTSLTNNEWYFIGAALKNQSLQIYLRNTTTLNELKVINLKNLTNRLTEDAFFTNGATKELANKNDFFIGSVYDIRLYINNIPNEDQINEQYLRLPCPKNCVKCNKFLTCDVCKTGFKLQDNICVDNKLSQPIEMLDKYSFFNNDTISLNIPLTFNYSQYTVNFFYRKKIHTYVSHTHNVLSIEGTDGRIYPLIQETYQLKENYTFTIKGQNSTGNNFTHDFLDEIYTFIHILIEVDITKKSLNFVINDGTDHIFRNPITTGIRRFILGDSLRSEMNFEIGNFYLYEGLIAKEDIVKLRAKVPLDCNPGCVSCDYKTGLCNSCLHQIGTGIKECNNVLRGFSHAHLYYNHILDQREIHKHSISLNNIFKKDVNSLEYSIIGYFRLLDKKALIENKNSAFNIFRLSNSDNTANDLIRFDIYNENGISKYFLSSIQRFVVRVDQIKELEVSTEWVLILVTINVREKTIKYAIQQLNSARVYTDTIKLSNYPDKLVETAHLSLFGNGIKSSNGSNYLNIQIYRFYLGVNLKFDLLLLEKYKNNFPIVADPTCPADCERCILIDKNIVECLSCVKGYELENDKCYKSDSKYILLADQNVYTYLPPKSDMAIPASANLFPKNTITFYMRRNYSPKVQPSDTNIFKGGNVAITLNAGVKGDSYLIVSIDKYPNSLMFSIDQDFNEDYSWYLVIINYSSNQLDVIIKTNKQTNKKGLKLDSSIKVQITSISFNSLGDQVSIYAPNIILRNFYEIDFTEPSTFCELECDVCIDNKCVECQWGFKKDDKCFKNPVSIPVFSVGEGSEYTNQYSLRRYLDNPKPLRSRSWGIMFSFELAGSFESYAQQGGFSLFTIMSGANADTSNVLFNINLNTNNSFFITILNRYYLSQHGSAYGFSTNSFKTIPINNIYTIAISFDDDNNELTFYAYNSLENFIKQTFSLKGKGENLNLDTNLVFGSSFKTSKQIIIFEHIRFYFDSHINEKKVNKYYTKRHHYFQKSCINSTRISCKKCQAGTNLIGSICSPVSKININWLNQVRRITNFIPETVEQKLFFVNNANQFTVSFWYKFYTYSNDPFGILSLTMQDGKISYPLLKVHYNNNNLFVDLFDSTKKQVNGIKYDNLVTPSVSLSWTYISISVDIPSNTIKLYTYDQKIKKNRIQSNTVSNIKLNLALDSNKYATADAGFETTLKGVGFHFEISSLVFTPGWYAKDSSDLELYRLRVPRKCNYKCLSECDSNNLCPAKGYFESDINIDDIYINNKALKGKTDTTSLKSIRLFRQISEWLPDTDGNPVWSNFLLSVEIDVLSTLTSSYKANNNIILTISNSVNPNFSKMNMNDIIPSEVIQYGVLSVETTSEGLKFWIGSSAAGNSISYYNLHLQTLKDISKITLQIYMDSRNKRARIIAYIDDLRTFYDIKTVYPLQNISSSSLVYTHPSVTAVRVNVNNSRFLYDYNLNIRGKAQDTSTYPSKKCGQDCVKCSFVPKGLIFHCDRCEKGYMLINNACLKSNN